MSACIKRNKLLCSTDVRIYRGETSEEKNRTENDILPCPLNSHTDLEAADHAHRQHGRLLDNFARERTNSSSFMICNLTFRPRTHYTLQVNSPFH